MMSEEQLLALYKQQRRLLTLCEESRGYEVMSPQSVDELRGYVKALEDVLR